MRDLEPDVIGTIYEQTGTQTIDGEEQPVFTALNGFHVNFPENVPEIFQYRLNPKNPKRVYAGKWPVSYKFPDEATFRQFFPDPDEQQDGSTI